MSQIRRDRLKDLPRTPTGARPSRRQKMTTMVENKVRKNKTDSTCNLALLYYSHISWLCKPSMSCRCQNTADVGNVDRHRTALHMFLCGTSMCITRFVFPHFHSQTGGKIGRTLNLLLSLFFFFRNCGCSSELKSVTRFACQSVIERLKNTMPANTWRQKCQGTKLTEKQIRVTLAFPGTVTIGRNTVLSTKCGVQLSQVTLCY